MPPPPPPPPPLPKTEQPQSPSQSLLANQLKAVKLSKVQETPKEVAKTPEPELGSAIMSFLKQRREALQEESTNSEEDGFDLF